MPLDAAIRSVFAPNCPDGRHGHRFWRIKNWVVVLWKLPFEASVQKAQNGASTQLIKATSCVERPNATIKAEEPRNFSSYQTLITDTNWSYHAAMKPVKKSWRSWAPIAVKLLNRFNGGIETNMHKAAYPSGGMGSSNPRCWRGKQLRHFGDGVC
jgi:hypothetical protein